MLLQNINIILADDDKEDCLFFREALDELELKSQLTIVHDGDQLMHLLSQSKSEKYHVVFLDLNMPRKNGFTCLDEIKQSRKFKSLPIIILSTSYDEELARQLYAKGVQFYTSKPVAFTDLKKIIHLALVLVSQKNNSKKGKADSWDNLIKTLP